MSGRNSKPPASSVWPECVYLVVRHTTREWPDSTPTGPYPLRLCRVPRTHQVSHRDDFRELVGWRETRDRTTVRSISWCGRERSTPTSCLVVCLLGLRGAPTSKVILRPSNQLSPYRTSTVHRLLWCDRERSTPTSCPQQDLYRPQTTLVWQAEVYQSAIPYTVSTVPVSSGVVGRVYCRHHSVY